jgi:acyl dehydratase
VVTGRGKAGPAIAIDRVGQSTGVTAREYAERDVILYHLGIGAGADELDLVYERAPGGLTVCPTFAVVTVMEPMTALLSALNVPLGSILHGEQAIRLERAIPSRGTFLTTATVPAVYDKGKAALMIVETTTTDGNGAPLFSTRASLFCQGMGGFGGEPGPRAAARDISGDRPPEFALSAKTAGNQAALYRLSGDLNPLHIDPSAASRAGFPRPILHGLCTFGFVGRAVLRGICRNEAARLRELGVRFSAPVFPGETITTEGWNMGQGTWHLRVATERGAAVSGAFARIGEG